LGNKFKMALIIGLLALAAGLPCYFIQYRTETTTCRKEEDAKTRCQRSAERGTLIWATDIVGTLEPVQRWEVTGYYARPGYSAKTAKLFGQWIPLLLTGVAFVLVIRMVMSKRARARSGDL